MKTTFLSIVFLVIAAIGLAGCGDSGAGVNPFGPNDQGVNFTIGAQQGPNGGMQFTFSPSVDVKLTRLVITLGNASDTLTDNGQTTYTAGQPVVVPNEYQQVAGTYIFYFNGTIASSNAQFTNAADTLTIQ